MEPKKKRAYTKPAPKPKTIPVYRFPSTNILHHKAGFIVDCPHCGQSHPHGPLARMEVGVPMRMPNWCHAVPLKPTPVDKITNFAGTYKLTGPIPAKLRATYAASEAGACDDALTYSERRRAKATMREAARLKRAAAG